MNISPLAFRVFLLTAAAVIATLAVALLMVSREAGRAADAALARGLGSTRASIAARLEAREQEMLAVAERLAQVPSYLASLDEGLRQGDRASLLDQAGELRDQLGAAWVLLADADGTLQAWSGRPERQGDDLSQGALVVNALGGSPASGAWLEPADDGLELFQAVAVPLGPPGGGRPIGAVVAALPLDSAFADSLRAITGAEVAVYFRDTAGAASVSTATLQTSVPLIPLGRAQPDTAISFAEGGAHWTGMVLPLRTAGGEVVGGILGLRSREAVLAPFAPLRRAVWAALAAGIAIALLGAAVVARGVTRPVHELLLLTRRVASGDLSRIPETGGLDEIGELGRSFGRLVDDLREQRQIVAYLSPALARAAPAPPPAAAAQALQPGETFADRYQIRSVLGSGGMGLVYRVHDRSVDDEVALKLLHAHVVRAAPELLERFRQEIRLARRITHQNVVRTHDLGEHEGRLYLTMELVEGTTLDRLIRDRGRLPVAVVLALGRQLCRALEVAHANGVIHRDIKPQNLLVDAAGVLKVSDFGIARLAERRDTPSQLTSTGFVIGTPGYMPPEQLFGANVDHRADIYAAGAVLHECLAGAQVFAGDLAGAILVQRTEQYTAADLMQRNPEVPEALARVIERALSANRELRWPTAEAMREALDEVEAMT